MRRNFEFSDAFFMCVSSKPFRFLESNASFQDRANISFCGL